MSTHGPPSISLNRHGFFSDVDRLHGDSLLTDSLLTDTLGALDSFLVGRDARRELAGSVAVPRADGRSWPSSGLRQRQTRLAVGPPSEGCESKIDTQHAT